MRAPPPLMCARPGLLLAPGSSYMSLGGTTMPLGDQVRAPPLCAHPPSRRVRPPTHKRARPPQACAPPYSQACAPLPRGVRTPPLAGVRASPLVVCTPSQACAPLHCRSGPHLCRLRPIDLPKVLPWKSTSYSPMPCQPTVLTGDKT
jgi:hypothetical protein